MTHEARLPDEGQSSGRRQAAPAIAQESSPSLRAVHNEQQEWLEQALEQLPADQQRAVRLRYFHNLSLAEIAEQMGRSLSATAGLLKRGLQGLNKQRRE
jgi:RNA polymerase sigma factor (sigma-70 family)